MQWKNAGCHPHQVDPRQRGGNQPLGPGTLGNDRPAVVGVVGRKTAEGVLEVIEQTDQQTLPAFVADHTAADVTGDMDEWWAYARVPAPSREPARLNHFPGERGRLGTTGSGSEKF